MPAGRGLAPLDNVPNGECGDGPPQFVIRRKHPVVAVPVLARRRTRSVSAARSAWLIGRTGRNAGEASHPAPSAAGTKTPSVAHTCRCTWWLSAEPKRWRKETAPSLGRDALGEVGGGLGHVPAIAARASRWRSGEPAANQPNTSLPFRPINRSCDQSMQGDRDRQLPIPRSGSRLRPGRSSSAYWSLDDRSLICRVITDCRGGAGDDESHDPLVVPDHPRRGQQPVHPALER